MRNMPAFIAFSSEERMFRSREYSEGKAPREVSAFVDRLTRFLVAMTGAIFLVVPMIIMTLHQSQTKSLITVSVSVISFSLIMALGVRVSNVEALISTATYAAVLMVFLGVNSP